MADSMAGPSKRSRETVTVTGYIHSVTPVKLSKRSTTKYFNATLQSQEDFVDVVVFSPQQHQNFVSAEKNRTPVKLTDVGISMSQKDTTKQDIQFLSSSKLSLVKQNLAFKFDNKFSTSPIVYMSIKDVMDKIPPFQKVNILVKILSSKNEPEEQTTSSGDILYKQTFVAADGTETIDLTVWGEKIQDIKAGSTYNITKASVRLFGNKKCLTTTPQSDIQQHEPLETTALPSPQPQRQEIKGSILQAMCTLKYYCTCKAPLEGFNTQAKSVKCQSCNMRLKTTNLSAKIKTLITIKSSGKIQKLSVPQNILAEIFPNQTLNDTDQIEEDLLDLEDFYCTFTDFTVTSITPPGCESFEPSTADQEEEFILS